MAETINNKYDSFYDKDKSGKNKYRILMRIKTAMYKAYNLFYNCEDDSKSISLGQFVDRLERYVEMLNIILDNKYGEDFDNKLEELDKKVS